MTSQIIVGQAPLVEDNQADDATDSSVGNPDHESHQSSNAIDKTATGNDSGKIPPPNGSFHTTFSTVSTVIHERCGEGGPHGKPEIANSSPAGSPTARRELENGLPKPTLFVISQLPRGTVDPSALSLVGQTGTRTLFGDSNAVVDISKTVPKHDQSGHQSESETRLHPDPEDLVYKIRKGSRREEQKHKAQFQGGKSRPTVKRSRDASEEAGSGSSFAPTKKNRSPNVDRKKLLSEPIAESTITDDGSENDEGNGDESEGDELPVRKTSTKSKAPSTKTKIQRGSSPAIRMARHTTPTIPVRVESGSIEPLKILITFSALQKRADLPSWLAKNGALIIPSVPCAKMDFFCVTVKRQDGKVPTTFKLLQSLLLGQLVVTDDWITDSMKANRLLDSSDYEHPHLAPNLSYARRTLFDGKEILFTTSLQKQYGSGWRDVQSLARAAGAVRVGTVNTQRFTSTKQDDALVIGNDKDDVDATWLMETAKKVVYHKDLLAQSILSGELDLTESAYKLQSAPIPTRTRGSI